MGRIQVGVNIGGLHEVQAAYRDFRSQYVNRLVKAGAIKAGRKTVPELKRNTRIGKRTGMLEKARGYRYRSYKRNDIWVVLVGARSNMHANHSFWGKIVPTKYDHLFEGGRAAVRAGTRTTRKNGKTTKHATGARVLAMKVKSLAAGTSGSRIGKSSAPQKVPILLLNRATGNLAKAMRNTKHRLTRYLGGVWRVRKGKKVPGGWIVFAMSAAAVTGRLPVENAEPWFASHAPKCVIDELRTGLPRILAKYGNKVYR